VGRIIEDLRERERRVSRGGVERLQIFEGAVLQASPANPSGVPKLDLAGCSQNDKFLLIGSFRAAPSADQDLRVKERFSVMVLP
jgi:hypothetical protein